MGRVQVSQGGAVMSEYGHASAVLAAFNRAEREQRRMRTVEHVPCYNTLARCTLCGIGKYEHTVKDGTRR